MRLKNIFKKSAAASALLVAVGSCSAIADEVYYVHSDHLNAPMVVTDQAKQVVWQGNRQPFGKTEVVVNTVSQPIRFPGQYEDVETGLHYNLMRDYDPNTGRYLQSDPLGLYDGPNTYTYVYGNPLSYTDPTGEYGLLGGVIGGIIDLGLQLSQNGGNFACVSWGQVGASAALGIVTGGMGSLGRAATTGAFKHSVNGLKWSKSSKSYKAVAPRYKRFHNQNGSAPKGQWEPHHWAVGLAPVKRNAQSWRNHPLNLNPLPKNVHRRIHGSWSGQPRYNSVQRWWYGTPSWYKQGQVGGGIAGGVIGNTVGGNEGCGCNL